MIILAIETSCDDTGIAIVEKKDGKIKTLSSVVSSQDEIHKKWGGVYPTEAKREHQKNIIPSLEEALKKADLIKEGGQKKTFPEKIKDILQREEHLLKEMEIFFSKYETEKIDAIAVTVGPGLEPCLWVGVNFAKALAFYLQKPLIPVNHIMGHIFYFLKEGASIEYPALALTVSGGHTELVLMESPTSFSLIGKTRDDAAGECFDKIARILGLGYPGGPLVSLKAAEVKDKKTTLNINLPRPMKHTADYDFSFSGLKTAVLYDFKSRSKDTQKNENYIREMCQEAENAIIDVLTFKLEKGIKELKAKTVILGGGVTANKALQEKIKSMEQEFGDIKFFLPPKGLSTDNAEMIALAATMKEGTKKIDDIKPNANLKIYDKM